MFWQTALIHSPKLMLIGVTFFSVSVFHIKGLNYFLPMLDVIVVFYWSVMLPRLMPIWFVVLMGFVTDMVIGTTLGLHGLLYLLLVLSISQKRYRWSRRGVRKLWKVFSSVAAFILFAEWLLESILHGAFLPATHVLMQYALTMSTYPLWHAMLASIHSKIPEQALSNA